MERKAVPSADSSCINWNGNWQLPSTTPGNEGPFLHLCNHFLLFFFFNFMDDLENGEKGK